MNLRWFYEYIKTQFYAVKFMEENNMIYQLAKKTNGIMEIEDKWIMNTSLKYSNYMT